MASAEIQGRTLFNSVRKSIKKFVNEYDRDMCIGIRTDTTIELNKPYTMTFESPYSRRVSAKNPGFSTTMLGSVYLRQHICADGMCPDRTMTARAGTVECSCGLWICSNCVVRCSTCRKNDVFCRYCSLADHCSSSRDHHMDSMDDSEGGC